MSYGTFTDPKDPLDTEDYSIDFSLWANPDETILSATMAVYAFVDDALVEGPTDLTLLGYQLYDGSNAVSFASVANGIVTGMFAGGTVGNSYLVRATVNTANTTATRSAVLNVTNC